MFESAELGHKIDRKTFQNLVPALRTQLLDAQYETLRKRDSSVIILISGVDGSGKNETINQLYSWMDPRHLSTLAFADPSEEERNRPFMWRFWRALPAKGKIGIFANSWYLHPISDRIQKKIKFAEMTEILDEINRFEAMLVNEGALVLKFWFHLSKTAQYKRLKNLEKDPRNAWRVTKREWDRTKTYDSLQTVAEHVLRATNKAYAPWTIVEGTDDNYRSLTVAKIISDAIRSHLSKKEKIPIPVAPPIIPSIDCRTVLTHLNISPKLNRAAYEKELAKWQSKLSQLVRSPRFTSQHSLVLAFEGADAAGKGGAIRRVVTAMDAQQYQIVPIAAPTDEELSQPYLWRFWRHIPRTGRVTLFDRTWYGRVLVERVEGYCQQDDWLRAYTEINDFEHSLSKSGAIIVKFWLQISKDEQLARFKERENSSFKRFKITEEDWRNREQWDVYAQAVCDMVERTSTVRAPWTLIPSDNKYHARIEVLRTVCERIEAAI